MQPITSLTSHAALLLVDDVDTDQIIPARFLTTTQRAGLGVHLFADWRFDPAGRPRPDFSLNAPEAADAQILIAGRNFGCGSSREHAAWALLDHGFRAVIAASFSDIFTANALKNGLLPVSLAAVDHDGVMAALRSTRTATTLPGEDPSRPREGSRPGVDPSSIISIDLASQTVGITAAAGALHFTFPIDPFAKHCLVQGIDQLGFLLAAEREIAAYEERHSATVSTAT